MYTGCATLRPSARRPLRTCTSLTGMPNMTVYLAQASRVYPTNSAHLYKAYWDTHYDCIFCTRLTGLPDMAMHPKHRGSGAPNRAVHSCTPKYEN